MYEQWMTWGSVCSVLPVVVVVVVIVGRLKLWLDAKRHPVSFGVGFNLKLCPLGFLRFLGYFAFVMWVY